jgi:hypothetical protein
MSTFTWIDNSEKQRRQMLDAIDMFREKDTRDELGVAGIRDTFSDMLFPGTGALQTRARYFLFVPWMYLQFEEAGVSSAQVARKGREFEIKLIDRLAESADPEGTIGIQARSALQRIPSSIYWNGLKLLRICQFHGSQVDYHRSLDQRKTVHSNRRSKEDGEIAEDSFRVWHAGLPQAPAEFPSQANFALTGAEARYLKGRVLENHCHTLFAFLLDRGYEENDDAFVWLCPASEEVPAKLQRQIEHARCFSEVIHGAAILYNLFLGELDPRRPQVIDDCETMLKEWAGLIEERHKILVEWDRRDFWTLLAQQLYMPSNSTQKFVESWCVQALGGDPAMLRNNEDTRRLIFGRERNIKGALARCDNHHSREMWRGEAGLGWMDFRWSNARVLLRDIAAGLAGDHA